MHVILLENSRYFTDNFTCGTHANLPVIGMRNFLLLQAKLHAICRQKTQQLQVKYPQMQGKIPVIAGKIPAIASKNTRYYTQNYPE